MQEGLGAACACEAVSATITGVTYIARLPTSRRNDRRSIERGASAGREAAADAVLSGAFGSIKSFRAGD